MQSIEHTYVFLTFLIFIKNEIKFYQCYKMYPISVAGSWTLIPFVRTFMDMFKGLDTREKMVARIRQGS